MLNNLSLKKKKAEIFPPLLFWGKILLLRLFLYTLSATRFSVTAYMNFKFLLCWEVRKIMEFRNRRERNDIKGEL